MDENKKWVYYAMTAAFVFCFGLAMVVAGTAFYENAHRPYQSTIDGKTVVCTWSEDVKTRTETWDCK